MLAHGMNGDALRPDHGKPLRAVVPGQIGGRSVKWLKRLIVSEQPSDNWYHIYDNRVLPTIVTPDEAAKMDSWWKDERYAIYDLSPNSAVARPAHDERLQLLDDDSRIYTCKGYAYAGGGRRVTRVEVSIDQGKNWRLSSIDYCEDLYRETEQTSLYGGKLDVAWRDTCFCWCFWSCSIPAAELRSSKDILVRAMDEGMSIQPRDMYWNVLGMMNNPWYRITINCEGSSLLFEHPIQPASIPGGWMEKAKRRGANLTNGYWGEQIMKDEDDSQASSQDAEVSMTKSGLDKLIHLDELRSHTQGEPWFVLDGQVYDGTSFLESHPGGAQSIVSAAATDVTEEFLAIRK